MRKKLLSLLLSALLLTSFSTSTVFASTKDTTNSESSIESQIATNNNKLTKDSYISLINEKVKNANGNEKDDLKNALRQFKSLTKEKQDKFIEYMNNPESIINAVNMANNEIRKDNLKSSLKTLNSIQSTSNKVLNYNDDIKVKVNSTAEDVADKDQSNLISTLSASSTKQKKVTYTSTITLFGVEVFKAIVWIKYSYIEDEEVVSCDSGDAYTSKNYDPLLSTDWSDINLDYNDTDAWGSAEVSFDFVYSGSGITYGSCELGVDGDCYGDYYGWTDSDDD